MTLFLLGNLAFLLSITGSLACFHPRVGLWLGIYEPDLLAAAVALVAVVLIHALTTSPDNPKANPA